MEKTNEMTTRQQHPVSDPLREMLGLRDTISGLFDDFFSGRPMMAGQYARSEAAGTWSPAVNIRETDQGITLHVALPGVEKNDVQLEIKDDTLVLSGRSRLSYEGENWLRTEIPSGDFYRAFSLPAAIKPNEVKASCKDGVLYIELPKTEQAKPRKVPIN